MNRNILITGATGEQGGSVINALLEDPTFSSKSTILAVTRNVSSRSALDLARRSPAIKLIHGNLDDVSTLFDHASAAINGDPIWGVFSVQAFMGKGASVETEERQGKALVNESLRRGVSHFVYTSVERGGDDKSWDNPTNVPHFISKHRIEHHLRNATKLAASPKMSWTILRPVTFLQNIHSGFFTKIFLTTWRYAVGQKPLQLVSTKDIGWFGAKALLFPELYQNKAIGLAGDEVTFTQVNETFLKVTGRAAPTTFDVFAWVFMWAFSDLSAMFRWFATDGAKADLPRLAELHPDLINLETHIRREYMADL